jgi:hypothetical protein
LSTKTARHAQQIVPTHSHPATIDSIFHRVYSKLIIQSVWERREWKFHPIHLSLRQLRHEYLKRDVKLSCNSSLKWCLMSNCCACFKGTKRRFTIYILVNMKKNLSHSLSLFNLKSNQSRLGQSFWTAGEFKKQHEHVNLIYFRVKSERWEENVKL